MAMEVGNIVEGKVVKIMPFGAFVSLPDNQSGLVHISEITSEYIEDINEHIKIGDCVRAKVITVDKNGKIALSIKKAIREERIKDASQNEHIRPADIDWSAKNDDGLSFEDKLSKFKKDADERMLDLKRSKESKRSGGYHRGGNTY